MGRYGRTGGCQGGATWRTAVGDLRSPTGAYKDLSCPQSYLWQWLTLTWQGLKNLISENLFSLTSFPSHLQTTWAACAPAQSLLLHPLIYLVSSNLRPFIYLHKDLLSITEMLRLRISSLVNYIVQISCTLDSFKWLQEVSESPFLIRKTVDFFPSVSYFSLLCYFPYIIV